MLSCRHLYFYTGEYSCSGILFCMKLFFKVLGVAVVIIGCLVNALAIFLSVVQGSQNMALVVSGAVFIALGMSIIVVNKKGHTW